MSEVGLSQAARGTCAHAEGSTSAPRRRAPAIPEGRPLLSLATSVGGVVQLLSGVHRNVSADGTVEVTKTDAAPLLSAGWVRA